MAKKVFFRQEARKKFQKGINMVADSVGSTLGARGRGVIIAKGYGHYPSVTKDGVTVANDCFWDDEVENAGGQFIREACNKTLALAGDGTTTTAVLAHNILTTGLNIVDNKYSFIRRLFGLPKANAQEIRIGIEKGVDCILSELKSISIPVDSNDMIRNIATVSANNDSVIGNHIADLYAKVGNEVSIDIKKSTTFETYTKTVDGSEISAGYSNDGFCNDFKKMETVFENPLIFVTNYEIKNMKEMTPFLNSVANSGVNLAERGIVFISTGFEGEFHNTMLVGKMKNGMKICIIQAPSSYQKEFLKDTSILTGATLVCDEVGMKLEHANITHCGTCEKIIVTKYPTTIIQGGGSKEKVEQLKSEIKTQLDATENEEVKTVLQKRLARLSGTIGIIYVGGHTTTETEERLARVDDAVRATKSAVEEGIVAGGGVALIRCMDKLDSIETVGDESKGVDLIRKACLAPLTKMLSNAGLSNDIVSQVQEQQGNFGYNIKTKTMEDLVVSGVIDPAKVVRCALQSASSVATQVITSDVLLVEMKPIN